MTRQAADAGLDSLYGLFKCVRVYMCRVSRCLYCARTGSVWEGQGLGKGEEMRASLGALLSKSCLAASWTHMSTS